MEPLINPSNQMYETDLTLNISELNILLAAMNRLTIADEKWLEEEYGSSPALYNKIYSALELLDGPQTVTHQMSEASYATFD